MFLWLLDTPEKARSRHWLRFAHALKDLRHECTGIAFCMLRYVLFFSIDPNRSYHTAVTTCMSSMIIYCVVIPVCTPTPAEIKGNPAKTTRGSRSSHSGVRLPPVACRRDFFFALYQGGKLTGSFRSSSHRLPPSEPDRSRQTTRARGRPLAGLRLAVTVLQTDNGHLMIYSELYSVCPWIIDNIGIHICCKLRS